MQNISVRFQASTDFAKAQADLAALTKQVETLQLALSKSAYGGAGKTPPVLDAGRWAQTARAVEGASKTYRDAISSSGMFTTQQIRSVSETEKFTKALQAQKLSMMDMIRNRGIMKDVYNDQLKMQRATVQMWGTDTQGRHVMDFTVPKSVPTELNNMRRQMGMFGNMAASAGTQVVNLGKNIQWSGRQLMVGFTYPMALFGAAAGVMAYKVDNAFASINKVYDFSAAAQANEAQMTKEQSDLRVKSLKTAEDAAKNYGSTIESTLKVEQELAATGLKGNSLLSTTTDVQRVSALGNIDPAETEKMVIALQNAFRGTIKPGKDTTDMLNFMNAAANATSLSLQDIVQAVPRAASAFASLGGDAKQMTVLLVAMRESGVEAAQGANAIKSASARILNNTILDKVTKQFQDFGHAINLQGMVNKSGGNFFDFIKLLGEAENKANAQGDKLSRQQKATANAALFGTYQFSRLTAALTNVSDAYGGVNNQTSKALALMHQTPAALAQTAAASQKAMMDNPAGKFRQEWAQLQIQLQEMGQPFLAVATDILSFFTKVAEGFNHMDNWKKKAILMGAGIAALVGPVVMVTGLMLNMTGQFIKGVGSIAKLLGISRIYTKEQKAAELAMQAQNEQLMALNKTTETNITLTDTMAKEVGVMAEAMRLAMKDLNLTLSSGSDGFDTIAAASTDAADVAVANNDREITSIEAVTQALKDKFAVEVEQANALSSYGQYQAVSAPILPKPVVPNVPPIMATGYRGESIMVADTAGQAKAAAAAEATYAAEMAQLRATEEITNQSNARARIEQKTGKIINGNTVSMGLMGASMATMMITSNKTADNIAKWTMIGSIVVPTLGMAIKAAEAFGAKMIAVGIATKAAIAGSFGNVRGVMGAAGGLRAGAGAAAAGVAEMINPLGVALALTTAIGVGMYMWHKHEEQIIADQVKAQDSLTNMATDWGAQMGVVENHYKGIANYTTEIAKGSGLSGTDFQKSLDYYSTGNGSDAAKKLGGLAPDQKDNAAMNAYTELVVRFGQTTKEAQTNITAMLVASGEDFYTANANAQRYSETLGNLKGHTLDWGKAVEVSGQYLLDIKNNGDKSEAKMKELDAAAKQFGITFATAFTNAKTGKDAQAMFDNLVTISKTGWGKIYEEAQSSAVGLNFLAAHHIQSATQLQQFGQTAAGAKILAGAAGNVGAMYNAQKRYQDELVQSVATALHLGKNIKTILDLQNSLVVRANQWNFDHAVKSTKQMMGNLVDGHRMLMALTDKNFNSLDFGKQLRETLKNLPTDELDKVTRDLLIIADSQGVKHGANAWETYKNIINGVNGQLDNTKSKIDAVPSQKNINLNISAKDIPGIVQTAMGNVQSMMVSSADNALQARQSAAQNALQARQQAASTALQNRQQAQQDALTKRFKERQDAINKSYDKRVNAIKKEMAAETAADAKRQAMYEAEKKRIQDLADAQNTNIDFNMAVNEGRLQDAAKILNTADAKAQQNEMDAEMAAEQQRTQARIDRLQKRTDRLEKERTAALDRLQNLEDQEKKHLDKVQQMRQQALQKQQAAETAAQQASQAAEKANLDAKLALFQSYVAKNQADLNRWMRTVGLTYDQFGTDITNKGQTWANSFQTELVRSIREAGAKVASDNMWSGMGKGMASELLKGIGFTGVNQFANFVKTGNLPKNFGVQAHHGGGVIGKPGTGRAGRSGPIGPDERLILAQDGEMMINKHASKKYGPLLQAINKGTWNKPDLNAHGGLAPEVTGYTPTIYKSFAPVSGITSAGVAHLFESGVGQSLRGYIKAVENSMTRSHHAGRHSQSPLAGYVPGPGGKHRPVPAGIPVSAYNGVEGGFDALDLAAPIGTPAYAIGNGKIITSAELRGYEPRRMMYGQTGPSVQDGYMSYGKYIVMALDSGGEAIYAHLSKRGVGVGQHVAGGSVIGRTGNTGNVQSSTGNGAHLHFGTEPFGPYAFLRRGGKLKWDNTPVIAHAGETMLSAPLTRAFEQKVASGGADSYNITIDLRGAYIKEDVDIEKAVNVAIDKRENAKGRSRVVRSKV